MNVRKEYRAGLRWRNPSEPYFDYFANIYKNENNYH